MNLTIKLILKNSCLTYMATLQYQLSIPNVTPYSSKIVPEHVFYNIDAVSTGFRLKKAAHSIKLAF